jgi:hypothetical protein
MGGQEIMNNILCPEYIYDGFNNSIHQKISVMKKYEEKLTERFKLKIWLELGIR